MASDPSTSGAAARERLRAIIAEKSFREGRFVLASGREASYFFDLKPTMLDPEGGSLIASMVLDLLEERPDVAAVGGLAMGAVPIVAAVAAMSAARARPVSGFFVRKETKDHGTERLVEGVLPAGAKVVVIEDVVTTGGSAARALAAIRARGCKAAEVIAVVDRLEGGAGNLAELGVRLVPLFDRKDFTDR